MATKKNDFTDLDKNLEFWNSVQKTDPGMTTPFTTESGFKGKSTDPLYIVKKVTARFGPIGIMWGFDEVEHKVQDGVWFSKIRFWYMKHFFVSGETGTAEITQWGGTRLFRKDEHGSRYTNDDAAKSSVTDGLMKCLTYLGFNADVHLGLHDDSKYVQQLIKERDATKPARNGASEPEQEPAKPQDAEPEIPKNTAGKDTASEPPAQGQPPQDAGDIGTNLPTIDGIQYVSHFAEATGQTYVRAKGKTRGNEDILKDIGFQWSPKLRGFFMPMQ